MSVMTTHSDKPCCGVIVSPFDSISLDSVTDLASCLHDLMGIAVWTRRLMTVGCHPPQTRLWWSDGDMNISVQAASCQAWFCHANQGNFPSFRRDYATILWPISYHTVGHYTHSCSVVGLRRWNRKLWAGSSPPLIEPPTGYTTLTQAVTGLALKKEEKTTDLRTSAFW